ncbi:hypothetical protein B5M09_013830 [Aphanomyces astaci]|uniref:DDE-1 domain-containing protein n=1 Tax=Aphanomyces astaci TaxID=112090 RepID=A0A3R7WHU7_APHAT|nr:hypothetical protein B5M09_013830 [Aphanomyces astaci]
MENEDPQAPLQRRPRGRPVLTGLYKARPKKFKYQNITYKKKMEVIECVDALGVAETLDRHFGHLRGPSPETTIDLGLPDDAFHAGWHWMRGFKKRHGLAIRARTRQGQDTQGDGEAVLAAFVQRVQAVVVEHGIDVIYNADQTGVNYEYLPAKIMQSKGEKTVWIKCGGKTKDRAKAMLLANSNGDKLPMFLVLKTTASKVKSVVQENLTQRHGFGKQVWKQVEPLQARFNCRLYDNPTAWWNSDISVAFLKFHFENRPDRSTKKVLLLWDDFSAHFTDEVVECAR